MTNVYQEGQDNGHQEIDLQQYENSNGNVEIDLEPIDRQFKFLRVRVNSIISQMNLAETLDSLLQATVAEIRKQIETDRVFIYRFNSPDSGVVLAESRNVDWTPTINETLPIITFGASANQDYSEVVAIDDITQGELTPYQLQLVDKYQIKASLILPILRGNEIWGLLVANYCAAPHQWQEMEISLLSQITTELTYKLQSFEFQKQLQQQQQEQKAIAKVIDKIQRSLDIEKIFQTATQEVRQFIGCDRVSVYRFNPDWSGEYIAESVAAGWVPLVGPNIKTVWEDTHLQETQGGRYRYHETFVINDIYQSGHSTCHMEVLEQFQVKAYVIVPVFAGEKLWGLLAAYQNTGSRQWQEAEINLLNQIAVQLGVAVSQGEYIQQVQGQSQKLAQIAEQERTLTKITNRIRQSLDVESIFKNTTKEVRQLLECDRVSVYRFHPDWSGEYVAESVASGWTPLVGENIKTVWEDTHLQQTQGGRYARGESFAIDDIYQSGHSQCHIDLLEQFEVKAYLIVPVFEGTKLWGLLAAYQNTGARHWQETEINLLTQIGVQLGVAVSQAEYIQQVQQKSQQLVNTAKRERNLISLTRKIGEVLIEKVSNTSHLDVVFQTAVAEIRQIFQADRTVVYRFNPDWSGEFVAEAVVQGWVPFLSQKFSQTNLQLNGDCETIRSLKKVKDTYLQQTQGGRYHDKVACVIDDVYAANFPVCYLELLQQFQARAYLTVPIFKEDKLWGLLANYQNSGPRHWEEFEIYVMEQLAVLLGVAIQQAENLEKLQEQSVQLTAAAARDKAAKEELQRGAMELLKAVRPALDGDLTVRAPITENELGTIADSYNNTIQALRQIVVQVQAAAQKVVEISTNSNTALTGLEKLAYNQSQEVSEALGEIEQMADSTKAVASNADLVQVAVAEANKTVESGDAAMNMTVEAIQGIRETVAQTSKKIKRLSESSQKISKVVNLIGSFATQTNVLALNAAIEATRAGEYGKGFAVVADEVRSLSRQSSAATIEIEKLVQEIQTETGEVAVAMETGIEQVVEGTNLVNETRQNLNAIVAATGKISELLLRITDATQTQIQRSASVTNSMKDVAEISHNTVTESQEIAAVFQQLSATAQELLVTVSKFKVQ